MATILLITSNAYLIHQVINMKMPLTGELASLTEGVFVRLSDAVDKIQYLEVA
jgi:hypothetical protein